MKLKCISSGSSEGNTYALISNSGEILLLDLGASVKQIKIGLDFNVSGIVGAIATHLHKDHSQSVKQIENMGIRVMKPYNALCEHFQMFSGNFGNYRVTAFALDDKDCTTWQHTNTDGSECPIYGFFITHPELENPFIYATDCRCIKWNFKKQKPCAILLGVDYQEDMLDSESEKYQHQLEGHMSIDTACEFVKANDTEYLHNIILGHLSHDSSQGNDFIERMKKSCSCHITIAHKGMSDIELSLPF